MSSAPSRNMTTPAELRLAQLHGYIVLDRADGPGATHRLAEVAEWFRATCAADDRPCAIAILGPRNAEVVLDMVPCSWDLCESCVARRRAIIADYPDSPTRALEMGPSLIRGAELSPPGRAVPRLGVDRRRRRLPGVSRAGRGRGAGPEDVRGVAAGEPRASGVSRVLRPSSRPANGSTRTRDADAV